MNIENELKLFCKHFGWEMDSEQIHEIRKYGEAVREEVIKNLLGEDNDCACAEAGWNTTCEHEVKKELLQALTQTEE
jgi:hypothetical protein